MAAFRLRARACGITEVVSAGPNIRFAPVDLPESAQLRLARLYPGSQLRKTAQFALVPRPMTAPIGGQPITDEPLLAWASAVLDAMFPPPPHRGLA